jgi:hypothetical protein
MKYIRLVLMLAAFLIMIGAVVNYYMIKEGVDDVYGVYLELGSMALIAAAIGILDYNKKRKNK